MSAAIVKTKLKTARDALTNKEYEKAKAAASDALDYDSENYNGNVFLGLALLELGDMDTSEQVYLKAITANPDLPLAWQGISRLYERAKKWDKYADSLIDVAKVFAKMNDATKCAESLQKLLDIRRGNATRLEVAETLSLFLPESPFYAVLSQLPPPDSTNPTSSTTLFAQTAVNDSLPILEEIISIVEQDEAAKINTEVEKRRQRLNAQGPQQIMKEVGREVWSASKLPNLYQEVINHPNTSDELRRLTESKLLQYRQQLLFALPSSADFAEQKESLSREVEEMINGIVLLGIPNEQAWILFIDGKDAANIDDYDYRILHQFVQIFPESNLAKLLTAYFAYRGISTDDADDLEGTKEGLDEDEDYAAIVMDIFPSLPESLIGHRCVGEVYQDEEDNDNAIKIAENGLALLRQQESDRGIKLPAVKRAFNTMLATSLVHFFPPKHHTRALRLIDAVLAEDPVNVKCLLGRGYIMQHALKWGEGGNNFRRVTELLPDDLSEGLRAREEEAWCKVEDHDPDAGEKALMEVINILDNQEGRHQDQARCWWRLGKCRWELGDFEEAYRSFITSLKRLPSFAPAFTSLGIYYSDRASPPDPSRASKCFQKAFELDPRETEAARRLAYGFAEEREWDLVEVVARRTIDGEGGLEGGVDSVAPARYQPLNAWAWKALGVVELNRQKYPQAIQAFQISLRTEPDDRLSWLRLGEAYSKAGRYAAAIKALEKALELDPEDWVCSYFLGEVWRQMGQFQEAIEIFTDILKKVPSELRVLLSLGQSHLEFGRAQLAVGFAARAESSFLASIRVTLRSMDAIPGFRRIAWKIIADSLYELSRFSALSDPDAVLLTVGEVLPLVSEHPQETLSSIIAFPITLKNTAQDAMRRYTLEAALVSYSYRISLGSLNDVASASAHYDLGMSLCSYAQLTHDGSSKDAIHKGAISCLKDALKLDPLNDRYWNTLGNALFVTQPKTAQHAYIRALEVDTKNVATWANLGFLYLHHSDIELANEAFLKAQVLDPDFALAWVGQALVATANGHDQEATALFEHAIGMPAPVPEADVAFARRLLDRTDTSRNLRDISSEALSPAFFVLDRFCRQRPQDATAQHLFGLVCERVGHLDLAAEALGRSIALLEAAYEESEDSEIERQFAIANANRGRVRLAQGDLEGARESCQVVHGLLSDLDPTDEGGKLLLAQAELYSGLAWLMQGQLDAAVSELESALETATNSGSPEVKGHISVVMAQALWAVGTMEGQEAAKTRLLQSIDADPDNLTAVNTLAGMGVLTNDDDLVDAALSEILALPLDQRYSRDPQRDVAYLLIQHHIGQHEVTRALSIAEKAVATEPALWKARQQLASLQLQRHEPVSAQAILSTSALSSDGVASLRESLVLMALAEAHVHPTAAQKMAEKAVMLTPWNSAAWRALACTRSLAAAEDITK